MVAPGSGAIGFGSGNLSPPGHHPGQTPLVTACVCVCVDRIMLSVRAPERGREKEPYILKKKASDVSVFLNNDSL